MCAGAFENRLKVKETKDLMFKKGSLEKKR